MLTGGAYRSTSILGTCVHMHVYICMADSSGTTLCPLPGYGIKSLSSPVLYPFSKSRAGEGTLRVPVPTLPQEPC